MKTDHNLTPNVGDHLAGNDRHHLPVRYDATETVLPIKAQPRRDEQDPDVDQLLLLLCWGCLHSCLLAGSVA